MGVMLLYVSVKCCMGKLGGEAVVAEYSSEFNPCEALLQ